MKTFKEYMTEPRTLSAFKKIITSTPFNFTWVAETDVEISPSGLVPPLEYEEIVNNYYRIIGDYKEDGKEHMVSSMYRELHAYERMNGVFKIAERDYPDEFGHTMLKFTIRGNYAGNDILFDIPYLYSSNLLKYEYDFLIKKLSGLRWHKDGFSTENLGYDVKLHYENGILEAAEDIRPFYEALNKFCYTTGKAEDRWFDAMSILMSSNSDIIEPEDKTNFLNLKRKHYGDESLSTDNWIDMGMGNI